VALVPSVGLYYLAAVAAGLQKYHPRPAGLTGFIKLELEMGSIKRKGSSRGPWEHELTEIATRAPLYQALFSLRFSRKLSTS
jgi:hypothetical protein